MKTLLSIILFGCITISGCIATTKIIIKHDFPEEHIDYEIQQGWTKEY